MSINMQRAKRYKLTTFVSVGLLSVSLISACGGTSTGTAGSASAAASNEDYGLGATVLQAAKKEGTVSYATTILNQDVFDKLASSFEERYGIKVQYTSGGAAAADEQVRTDARAGKAPAFDAMGLGAYFLAQISQEGLLQPFRPKGFDTNTVLAADSPNYFPIVANVYGIAVNRSVVKDAAAPKSWHELAHVKIDAPVIEDDPSNGAGGYIWFATMLDAPGFGTDYLRQIGSVPHLQLGKVIADNVSKVVRGEAGIYFPMVSTNIGDLKGTDAYFVAPTEGPVITPIFGGVVKNATHADAAKLWLSFLWSKEGQEMLAQGAQAPLRKDATSPDPRWDLSKVRPVHVVSNQYLLDHLSDLQAGLPAQLGIK